MKITKEPQHYYTNMHTPEGRDIPAEQLRFAFAGTVYLGRRFT